MLRIHAALQFCGGPEITRCPRLVRLIHSDELTHRAAQLLPLGDIQAQQAITQARSAYITALAEHNKAQYALNKAVGGSVVEVGPSK
jgi:hypothetical protein